MKAAGTEGKPGPQQRFPWLIGDDEDRAKVVLDLVLLVLVSGVIGGDY